MKLISWTGAALVSVASAGGTPALAGGPEFGAPEFPNYLSRAWPHHATCDWWNPAYFRACPGVRVMIVHAPVPAFVKARPVVKIETK